MSVYDLSAESVGTYDLVFCGSMLLHVTDPVRALWRIREVTRGTATSRRALRRTAVAEPGRTFMGTTMGPSGGSPTACAWSG